MANTVVDADAPQRGLAHGFYIHTPTLKIGATSQKKIDFHTS